MRKIYYLYSCVALVLLCACVKDGREAPNPPETRSDLSIGEARAFFENQFEAVRTRAASDVRMPFVLGDVDPDWTQAGASSSVRVSSVDIPVRAQYAYRVIREDASGRYYGVNASSKIVVVKSPRTDSLSVYIRVCIPDEAYAALYDGQIGDMTLNCEDRVDYCGLEYYATLDGIPVAVTRYVDGRCVDGVFVYDTSLSVEECGRRFAALFRNMWIIPFNGAPATRANGEMDYWGSPGSSFIDSAGGVYIFQDTDGDGKSDSVTMLWSSGLDDGKGSGGSIGNPFGPGSGPGTGVTPGGPSGPGDGGNSGGGSSGDGDKDNTDNLLPDINPPTIKFPPFIRDPIDPRPFVPITPDIFPPKPDKPDEPNNPNNPDNTDEKKPCADSLNMEGNPLSEMKISDDNQSWKSNTWGYVRYGGTKFHDGLDLLGTQGETVVYAMYTGVVSRVVHCQPDRIGRELYPADYAGDKNGAGNRISIQTTLPDGRVIVVSYWHLDVAEMNPYTKSYERGDVVYCGQKIGVVGRTGNAYKQKPHLHVNIRVVGKEKEYPANNPYGYLYTKFDSDGNIIRDC